MMNTKFLTRFRSLFYLHNARSMVYMILVATHIFEIAESYLAADVKIMESISISPLQIAYAWISLAYIVTLITFVRIAEFYDKAGTHIHIYSICTRADFAFLQSGFIPGVDALTANKIICSISAYLYISLLSQASVFVIKIYKIILLMETLDLNDLRPFLIGLGIVGLILLVFLDSYTVYFEVSYIIKNCKSFVHAIRHPTVSSFQGELHMISNTCLALTS